MINHHRLKSACLGMACAFREALCPRMGRWILHSGTIRLQPRRSVSDRFPICATRARSFNPAGMYEVDGVQAQAAVNVLMPRMELTDTGSTSAGTGNASNPYEPTPSQCFYFYESAMVSGLALRSPLPSDMANNTTPAGSDA